MRIRQGDSLELTYCANIHPGETLDEVEENIRTYATAVKKQVAPEASMGIGLRLSNRAAEELTGNEAGLDRFCSLFEDHGLYAFTINGFRVRQFSPAACQGRGIQAGLAYCRAACLYRAPRRDPGAASP